MNYHQAQLQEVEVGIQCEAGQQKDPSSVHQAPLPCGGDQSYTCYTNGFFSLWHFACQIFLVFHTKVLFEEYTRVASSEARITSKLNVNDQILFTLMSLRLGLLLVDLAFRFVVSVGLASKIFKFWIQVLADISRKYLVMWLPQETTASTRPSVFTDFPNTTCIVDCLEILVYRAQNMLKRGRSYNPYKCHNTAIVLHVIALNDFIMFISTAYGGRASDRFITSDSGLLRCLLPGDQILADKGFTIEDMLHYGVELLLHSESRKSSSQMLKWCTRVACLNCAFMLKSPFTAWSVFSFWSIYPWRSLQKAIESTTPWLSSQGSATCSHRLLRTTEINVTHEQWSFWWMLTFLTTRHFSNLHAGQQVLAGSVRDKDLSLGASWQ